MELILQAIKALFNKVNIQLRELAKLAVPANWEAPEGEPGHVLNRTHYFESKPYEFPNTALEQASSAGGGDPGIYLLPSRLELIPGREYTVTYNGVEYTSKCQELPFPFLEQTTALCLGAGQILGGLYYKNPFVLFALEAYHGETLGNLTVPAGWGAVMDLSGASSLTISISGNNGTIKKLDAIYLPDEMIPRLEIEISVDDGNNLTITSGHTYYDVHAAFENGRDIMIRLKYDNGALVFLRLASAVNGDFGFVGVWPRIRRLWLEWSIGAFYLHNLAFDGTEE